MEVVQCLHHLVHVWYDEPNQPDFSESIKTRIELISDKVWYLINFVDENKYTSIEIEKQQVVLLAETLIEFIHFQCEKPNFWWKYSAANIVGIHLDVVEYLKWHSKLISLNSINYIKEVKNVYEKILSEDFLDILLDLVSEFYWKNIFNLESSDNFEEFITKNKDRRDELIEYAEKIIWKDRVIISAMNNKDIAKIQLLEYDIVWDFEYKKEYYSKKGISYELWHEKFGNAYAYVWNTMNDITKLRYKRYKGHFFETLKEKWFEIHPEITQHILWGEYYGRCINQYRDMLLLYWLESSKIEADQNISLIRFDDKLKGIY